MSDELGIPQHTRFGWTPDLPDYRDHAYRVSFVDPSTLPAKVDLREAFPPVYDQGNLGSCTAQAIAAMMEYNQRKQALKRFTPSRLFIYYFERLILGTVASDSGAMIRDGIKVVAKNGAPPEPHWPYVIAKFTKHPTKSAMLRAQGHVAVSYERLQPDLLHLKDCLASGYPFVFGFSVYSSFQTAEVARTGTGLMPQPGDRCLGGHAVLAVGYDDATGTFLMRNSWGDRWGQAGYFTLPYAYLTTPNLSDDFWTIRAVQ